MRFNVAFLVLAGLTFVAAQDKQSTSGQAPSSGQQPTGANGSAAAAASAGAGGASDVGALIQSLPKCFVECATKASSSSTVGCTGLTDISCICQKPEFLNATMVCITSSGGNECGSLAQNRTALQQGQTVFAGVCKAAAGAGGASGSGASAAGGSGGMAGMAGNETSSGGGSGAAATGGASGTSSTTSAPAGHNGAVIQHVATGSIVLTALLAGAATLL